MTRTVLVDGSIPTPWWFTGAAAMRRRKRHQSVFLAAGLYNLVWGAFTAASPQWLFDMAGMEAANHPQVFAALGMVVGLYGFMYLSVAAYPEYGWLTAAVGLTGKILGPAGLAVLMARGTWPLATIVICLTNDIVWWVPFAQYLRDARPSQFSHTAGSNRLAGGRHVAEPVDRDGRFLGGRQSLPRRGLGQPSHAQ